MSEFHVTTVLIDEVGPHGNADALEIAQLGGYPIVIRKGEFRSGSLAVYIPVDSVVPEDERFASIYKYTSRGRIRAARLRGVFSMGLLWPAPAGARLGEDFAGRWGITRYEAPEPVVLGGDTERDPGFIPTYTDIEGWRRYPHILQEGEPVVLTEKVHGCNARFAHDGERLWVGGRTQFLRPDGPSVWARVAREQGLADKLAARPQVVLYGEILGVQDLMYGLKKGTLSFVLFDALDLAAGRFLDRDDLVALAGTLDLGLAPALYSGPWSADLTRLAEGRSVLAEHVREGFVVKPLVERWHPEVGRVILKYQGEGYLLRKGG